MTTSIDLPSSADLRTARALRGYVAAVARAVGVGFESCTVDLDVPVSAYVALDGRHPGFPDRDLALLWDERHGWSAAIETHSGEDLIVLTYLGGSTVVPCPDAVAEFAAAVTAGGSECGQPEPPTPSGGRASLVDSLMVYLGTASCAGTHV
ncbi:DUF6292 family protein [Amycolatopsis sp. CA-230715]|uniref:DUF6292 family protein n=1 Tax=Amycolatopsis sp. CA-230715 TaxID=2745196 RepID=UPI001C32D347|nr:DUF6292 family protein [Amycolatopsis sp. CA-230715]QWF81104.1 hypothetical protein HUW46_04530 [Amycolatopsis sp. CA-230715]